jgi:hypothetical protein
MRPAYVLGGFRDVASQLFSRDLSHLEEGKPKARIWVVSCVYEMHAANMEHGQRISPPSGGEIERGGGCPYVVAVALSTRTIIINYYHIWTVFLK